MKKQPKKFSNIDSAFNNCPNGHKLPHEEAGRQCSPVYCAGGVEDSKATALVKANKERALVADKLLAKRARQRLKVRAKYTKVPDNLEGQDAVEWADKKLTELVPWASAEMEWQLKFGDDAQRFRAAERVLDSRGLGKKEMGGGGAALIILKGNDVITPPWKSGMIVSAQETFPVPVTAPVLPAREALVLGDDVAQDSPGTDPGTEASES